MKYRSAGSRKCLQPIQYRRRSTTAVNGHDPTARQSTGIQYVIKGRQLRLPMLLELGAPVEANLTNIHGLTQMQIKERQLSDPLMSDLRMQTQRCPYA